MGEREPELGSEELLDVRAADVLGFLDLDDTEDLWMMLISKARAPRKADVRGST